MPVGLIEGVTAIGGALNSLKTATDILKGFSDLKSDAERTTQIIELNRQIMAAQTGAITANAAQMTLIERVADLERQIADMDRWDTEKGRYELKQVAHMGSTAYVVRPEARGAEPPHCICAACYGRGRKGVLQPTRGNAYDRNWECPECKNVVVVSLPLPGYEPPKA